MKRIAELHRLYRCMTPIERRLWLHQARQMARSPFVIWMRRAALAWAILALASLIIAPPEIHQFSLAGLAGYLLVIIAYSLRLIYTGLRRFPLTVWRG